MSLMTPLRVSTAICGSRFARSRANADRALRVEWLAVDAAHVEPREHVRRTLELDRRTWEVERREGVVRGELGSGRQHEEERVDGVRQALEVAAH